MRKKVVAMTQQGDFDDSPTGELDLGFFSAGGPMQQIASSLVENRKASLAKVKEISTQAKQLGDLFSNFKLQR